MDRIAGQNEAQKTEDKQDERLWREKERERERERRDSYPSKAF